MYRAPRHGHITANPSPQGFVEVYDLSYDKDNKEAVAPDLIVVDMPYYGADVTPSSGPHKGKALTRDQASWEKYIPGKSPLSHIRSQYSRGFRRFIDDLANLANLDVIEQASEKSNYIQVPLTAAAAAKLGKTLAEGEIDTFKDGDMAKYLVGIVVNDYPYEEVTMDGVADALDSLNALLVGAKVKYRIAIPPIGCAGGGLTYGGDSGVYHLIKEHLQPAVDAGHVIYLLKPKAELQLNEPSKSGAKDPGIDSPNLYTEALYLSGPKKFEAITNAAAAEAYAMQRLINDNATYVPTPKEHAAILIEKHNKNRADLDKELREIGRTVDWYIKNGASGSNPVSPGTTEADRRAIALPSDHEDNIQRFAAEIPRYRTTRDDLLKKYRSEYWKTVASSATALAEEEPDYLEAMDDIEEYEKFGTSGAVSAAQYAKAKDIVSRSYLAMDKKRRKRALETGKPAVERLVSACLNAIRIEAAYESKAAEVYSGKAIGWGLTVIRSLSDDSAPALKDLQKTFSRLVASKDEKEREIRLETFRQDSETVIEDAANNFYKPGSTGALLVSMGIGGLTPEEAKAAAVAGANLVVNACEAEEIRARIVLTRELAVARSKKHEDDRSSLTDAANTTFGRTIQGTIDRVFGEILPKREAEILQSSLTTRSEALELLDRKSDAAALVEQRKQEAQPYLNSAEFMLSAVTGLRPMLEARTGVADSEYHAAKAQADDIQYIVTLLNRGEDSDIKEAVDKCAIRKNRETDEYESALFKEKSSRWLHDLDIAFTTSNIVRVAGLLTEALTDAIILRDRKLAAVAASEKTGRQWRRRLPNIPNLDVFLVPNAELTATQRDYKQAIEKYFMMSARDESLLRKDVERKAAAGEYVPLFGSREEERAAFARGKDGLIPQIFVDRDGLQQTIWVSEKELSTEKDDIRREIAAQKKADAIARGLGQSAFDKGNYADYIRGIEYRISLGGVATPIEAADLRAYKLKNKLETLTMARTKYKHELTGEDASGPAKTKSGKPSKRGISEMRSRQIEAELVRVEKDISEVIAEQHVWAVRAKVLLKVEADEELTLVEQDFLSASTDYCAYYEIRENALAELVAANAAQKSASGTRAVREARQAFEDSSAKVQASFGAALQLAEQVEAKSTATPRTPNPYMYKSGEVVPGIRIYTPAGSPPRTQIAGEDLLLPVYGLKERISRLEVEIENKKIDIANDVKIASLQEKIEAFRLRAQSLGLTNEAFFAREPAYREASMQLQQERDKYGIDRLEMELVELKDAESRGTWYSDSQVDKYYTKLDGKLVRKLAKLEDARGREIILPLDQVSPVDASKDSMILVSTATLSELRRVSYADIFEAVKETVKATLPASIKKCEKFAKQMKQVIDSLPVGLSDVKEEKPLHLTKGQETAPKLNAVTRSAAKLAEMLTAFDSEAKIKIPGTPENLSLKYQNKYEKGENKERTIQLTEDPQFGLRPLFTYEKNKRAERDQIEEIRFEMAYALYMREQASSEIETNLDAGVGPLPTITSPAPSYYELPSGRQRLADMEKARLRELAARDVYQTQAVSSYNQADLSSAIQFLKLEGVYRDKMSLHEVRDLARDLLGIYEDPTTGQLRSKYSFLPLEGYRLQAAPKIRQEELVGARRLEALAAGDIYQTARPPLHGDDDELTVFARKQRDLSEAIEFLELKQIYRDKMPLSEVQNAAREMLGIYEDPETGTLRSSLFDRQSSQWVANLGYVIDNMALAENDLVVDTSYVLDILYEAEDTLVPEQFRRAYGLPSTSPRAQVTPEQIYRESVAGIQRRFDRAGELPAYAEGYRAPGAATPVEIRHARRKLSREASGTYQLWTGVIKELKELLDLYTGSNPLRFNKEVAAEKNVADFRKKMAERCAKGESGIDAYLSVLTHYQTLGSYYQEQQLTQEEASYLDNVLKYNRNARARLGSTEKGSTYGSDRLEVPKSQKMRLSGYTGLTEARIEQLKKEEEAKSKKPDAKDAATQADLATNRLDRVKKLQDMLDRSSGSARVMLLSGDLLRKEYDELCLRAYEDSGLAVALDKSATAQRRASLQNARALSDELVKKKIVAGGVRRLLPLDTDEDQRDFMKLPPGVSPPRDTAATAAQLQSQIRDLAGYRTYAEYLVALLALQGESLAKMSAEVYRRRAQLNRRKAGRGGADEGVERAEQALFDVRNDSPALADFAAALGVPTQLEANSGESRYAGVQNDPLYVDLTGSKRDKIMEPYNKQAIGDFVAKELEALSYKCSLEELANPVLALSTAQRRRVITNTQAKNIARRALLHALDLIVAKGALPTFVQPVSERAGRMLAFGQDEILDFLATAGINPDDIGFGGKNLTLIKNPLDVERNLLRLRSSVLTLMHPLTAEYYQELFERNALPGMDLSSREAQLRDVELLVDQANNERDMACLIKTPGETIAYIIANSPELLARKALPKILSAVHYAVEQSLRGAESGKSYLENFITAVTAPGSGILPNEIVSPLASSSISMHEVKSRAEVANILKSLETEALVIAKRVADRGEMKFDNVLRKATPGETIFALLTTRREGSVELRYHAYESGFLKQIIDATRGAVNDATSNVNPAQVAVAAGGLASKQMTLFERTAKVEEEFIACAADIRNLQNILGAEESTIVTPGALYPATASQSSRVLEGGIQALQSDIESRKRDAKGLIQQLNALYKQGDVRKPPTAVLVAIEGITGAQQPRPTVLTFRDLPGAPQGQGKPPDRASNPGSAARYRDRMSGRRNNPEETLWHYEETGPVDLLTEGMSGSRSKRATRRMNPETSPVISAFADVFGMHIDTSACDTSHRFEVQRAHCLVRLQRDLTRDNVSHVLWDLGGDSEGLTGTFLKRVSRQAAQAIKLELRERPEREPEITAKMQAAMQQCLSC